MHTTLHVFVRHHRPTLVLVALNAIVGVLLWGGIVMLLRRPLYGSIPFPPTHRLSMTILPVNTGLPPYPNYPSTIDYSNPSVPNGVWVHVWTHDTGQHALTTYVVTLPLCRLGVLLLLVVNPSLTLLTLGLWYGYRRGERAKRDGVKLLHVPYRKRGR
jgi:hypothetical protein